MEDTLRKANAPDMKRHGNKEIAIAAATSRDRTKRAAKRPPEAVCFNHCIETIETSHL
jgi:hypothetical protein